MSIGHMMYLENNFALVKQDIRRTSLILSLLFGTEVTDADVFNFEQENRSRQLSSYRRPRTAERGAFGRRPMNEFHLRFDRDARYWPLYNEEDEDELLEAERRYSTATTNTASPNEAPDKGGKF